jgi:hypothetical protein
MRLDGSTVYAVYMYSDILELRAPTSSHAFSRRLMSWTSCNDYFVAMTFAF